MVSNFYWNVKILFSATIFYLPKVLPENVLPLAVFAVVGVCLGVSSLELLKSCVDVLLVVMDKLPHGVEGVDVLVTRPGESSAGHV